MSQSLFIVGRALRNAAIAAARQAALNAAIQPRRGMNNYRGLGGDWDEYGYYYDNGGGGGYYDDWSGLDPYYGGGPGTDYTSGTANPPDGYWTGNTGIFNWDWTTPGINPDSGSGSGDYGDWQFDGSGWYDPATGIYVDQYGGASDTYSPYQYTGDDGQQYIYDPWSGISTPADIGATIDTTEYGTVNTVILPDNTINLQDLGSTLDWWNEIGNDPAPVTLPNITYNAGYIRDTPSTTLASDPNAPPALRTPGIWDRIKKVTQQQLAKKTAPTSGSPGAGGASAKPQTAQPKADGTCPAGYAKHPTTGQCTLIPANKPGENMLSDLLSNPYLLLGGAILIAIVAKK